jgi:hypothetical protein
LALLVLLQRRVRIFQYLFGGIGFGAGAAIFIG